ncbi:hypothetical protein NGTWS0302_24800 [Mycolicibacterium cyprinidarum]|uniref:Uncharacterized protein n=1 Tax=Mycolicibacterium cyprinidarum TaxID=2860311 RepID=A0ABQ4VCX0_9MYCO|nr:hypothetical protein NGTWS0302_24800 [Mycolicibacterium sp. NGTWS0302]GJF17370.1 hypothetical protein NGTWS1702_23690 [Mycolicibacterium sp. NGTWSNA01]
MLSAIAIVPSAPVMVPELAATAASETAELRGAALSAVAALPPRWIGIGVAATDSVAGPDTVGTFAGYGADIEVGLSGVLAAGRPPVLLPLCALITAWLRGVAQPEARAQVRAYRSDHRLDVAMTFGRQLRAEIDAAEDSIGVLVIADGANTLSSPAPGGYDPDSIPVQAALDDALAVGDRAALTRLPDGIVGRVAYQVLAGLTETSPPSATELYRGAPYGVGYFVGLWYP